MPDRKRQSKGEVEKPRKPGRPRDKALTKRRCDEILDAAVAVFAEHGYRLTDVQVIADRLSVGKGTVYRYFESKEALFLAAVDRGMQRLQETIDKQLEAEPNPVRQMRRAVEAYLAYFDTHPALVELLIQERAEFKDREQSTYFYYEEQCRESRRERLKQLQSQGVVRKIPADRIIDVANNVMYGAIFTNRLAGRRKSFQAQADEILDVLTHGIFEPTAVEQAAPDRGGTKKHEAVSGRSISGSHKPGPRSQGGRQRKTP